MKLLFLFFYFNSRSFFNRKEACKLFKFDTNLKLYITNVVLNCVNAVSYRLKKIV